MLVLYFNITNIINAKGCSYVCLLLNQFKPTKMIGMKGIEVDYNYTTGRSYFKMCFILQKLYRIRVTSLVYEKSLKR